MLSVMRPLCSETVMPFKVPQKSQIHDTLTVYFLLSRRGNRIYPRSFSCYMAETEFKSRLKPGMLVHMFSSSTGGKGGGRGRRLSVSLRPARFTYQVLGPAGLHRDTCVERQQQHQQTQRPVCKSRTYPVLS